MVSLLDLKETSKYRETLEKTLELIIRSIEIRKNADELNGRGKVKKDASYYLEKLKEIK